MNNKLLPIITVFLAAAVCLLALLFVSGCGTNGETGDSENNVALAGNATPAAEPTAEPAAEPTPVPTRGPTDTPTPTVTIDEVREDIRKLVYGLEFTGHRLRSTPVRLYRKDNRLSNNGIMDDGALSITVRSDETEPTEPFSAGKDEIISKAKEYLAANLGGVTWDDFLNGEPTIQWNTVATVDLDGKTENEEYQILSATMTLQTRIDGIDVRGDKYMATVDGQGVARCFVRHANFEVVDDDRPPVDRDALCITIEETLRQREAQAPFITWGEVKDYTVVYENDSGTYNDGTLDPIMTINFTEGYPLIVNLSTGDAKLNY